jgi:hypothetical protein
LERDLGNDSVGQCERSCGACIGQQEAKFGSPKPRSDVGRADRAPHPSRHFVENLCGTISTVLGHQLSEIVDRNDATRKRIQVPLRFLEFVFEALMEVAVVRQCAELLVQRRIAELFPGKLHVVVRSLHSKHVLNPRQELCVFERLRHVIVRSGAQPLDTRTEIARRREKNDRHEAIRGDGLDDFARVDAVQPRHLDVEHHEVDLLCANRVDRLLAVASRDHDQASRPKQLGYMLARRAIVIGNDDDRLWKWPSSPH